MNSWFETQWTENNFFFRWITDTLWKWSCGKVETKKCFHATTSSRLAMPKYHIFSNHRRKLIVRDRHIVAANDLLRFVQNCNLMQSWLTMHLLFDSYVKVKCEVSGNNVRNSEFLVDFDRQHYFICFSSPLMQRLKVAENCL